MSLQSEPVSEAENSAAPRPRRFSWTWPIAAILLVGASGMVRAWQDFRIEEAAESVRQAPFPLSEISKSLGPWRAFGEDRVLEAEILEIAGASDYLNRVYVDERTGQVLSVLVVFGPAEEIVGHSPAVCYPAVGYEPSAVEKDAPLDVPGEPDPVLRSCIYTQGQGATLDLQEVYWSFRHEGVWTPTSNGTRKTFRSHPAMFKVQVERFVGPAETRGANNPSEELLKLLIPEIEAKIAAADDPNLVTAVDAD